ncbi:hypothetical protein DFJ43DRAFT_1069699 [Lentinula guzmanii]|uniref:Nudix hydrolase domain-containing protein n=1 Tax=Lentinula guzmanii TaxID=2804957 RepID=A0AA38N0Z3_9AGAR|nr:hypothetical protein DFJ43DRAFT_1069699 [Lentinula guzmanii]
MSIFRSRPSKNSNNSSSPVPSTSSGTSSQPPTGLPTTDKPSSSLIANSFRRLQPHIRPSRPLIFSRWSSPSIPHSGWACEDFMVGVGMMIIQPSTKKMVILYDHSRPGCFFLPRGRKDIGETLQEAVLREAYEESGFNVEFLPLYKFTRQPTPPAQRAAGLKPDTEPIYMTARKWGPKVRQDKVIDTGGEYFVSWFIGQIPENPVHHKGVGMPDEQGFQSFLVSFDEGLHLINPEERPVVQYALNVYRQHTSLVEEFALLKAAGAEEIKGSEGRIPAEAEASCSGSGG